MPWFKMALGGPSSDFLEYVLQIAVNYATNKSMHGNDAWELVRNDPWPRGAVLKVPNQMEGEYGYMALMADKVRVGSSYWNWFRQNDIFRKTFVYGKEGLNLSWNSNMRVQNGSVSTYSPDVDNIAAIIRKNSDGTVKEKLYSLNYRYSDEIHRYYFSPTPEIFAANADVLFFSMFKQYEKQFDWTEWMGNERKSIKIKPLKYYDAHGSSTYPTYFDPPLYPGVGSPAIGFSPNFFDFTTGICSQDEKEKEAAVYIQKGRHRLTIVINWREHWEVASVGFFEPFDSMGEYSFPAFTIGGTSGVLPLTELCWYGGSPRVEHGFRLDYTEANWSLSHGHPGTPATWWDGSQSFLDNYMYSNVQAMLPDGYWQSFASYGLRQDVYYNRQRSQYFSAHKEPERIRPKYYLMPPGVDLSGLMDLFPSNHVPQPYYDEKADIVNHSAYGLYPFYLVATVENNVNQNILGVIPNFYWCTQPVRRYGVHEIDGKTYLIIPNAWINRKYHIKNYFSVLLGEGQNNARQLVEMERLEKLSRNMNCAILLD